jgi:F0F1-type ATP synthase assembly protein I
MNGREPAAFVRYARGAGIVFEFTGTIAAGAFLGWWVDRHFATTPWGMIGSTVLATIGGFVRLLQVLRQFEHVDRRRPADDG